MACSNIFKGMTKYEESLDILISRYTVFGIWIQFLIWKYVLKWYFVVITPKNAFFKVRLIHLTKIRCIWKYEYALPKYALPKVKYAHICPQLNSQIVDLFQDYVRSGCVSQCSPDVVVSGSYDHTVRLWDRRHEGSKLHVNHGSPVEAVLLTPNGTLLITAGKGSFINNVTPEGGGWVLHYGRS